MDQQVGQLSELNNITLTLSLLAKCNSDMCSYCLQGYLRHILETPELSIPEEDVVALFGNIEAIFHFSR